MPIKTEIDGKEVEVYTPDEYAAVQKVADDNAAAAAAAKQLADERGANFTQYNKKVESMENTVKSLETTLAEKETRERETAKLTSLGQFHGNNEEIKKTLEENYAKLAGMPETTPQEIAERSAMAARMAGVNVNSQPFNPVFSTMSGEAPRSKPEQKGTPDEFYQSEKGKAALQAMGIDDAPKQ